MRSNQRIQELEHLAAELLHTGQWTPYEQGQKPIFPPDPPTAEQVTRAEVVGGVV
jgi:hypothetical protein